MPDIPLEPTWDTIRCGASPDRRLAEEIRTSVFAGEDSMLPFVRVGPHSEGGFPTTPEEQRGVLPEGECVRTQDGEEGALVLDVFSPPRPGYPSDGEGFGRE